MYSIMLVVSVIIYINIFSWEIYCSKIIVVLKSLIIILKDYIERKYFKSCIKPKTDENLASLLFLYIFFTIHLICYSYLLF